MIIAIRLDIKTGDGRGESELSVHWALTVQKSKYCPPLLIRGCHAQVGTEHHLRHRPIFLSSQGAHANHPPQGSHPSRPYHWDLYAFAGRAPVGWMKWLSGTGAHNSNFSHGGWHYIVGKTLVTNLKLATAPLS